MHAACPASLTSTSLARSTLFVAAIDAHTVPLATRELLAQIPDKDLHGEIRQALGKTPYVLIRTCLRVELLVHGVENEALLKRFFEDLLTRHGIDASLARFYQGDNAVRHLVQLHAGLESFIAGERQIGDQINKSFLHARNARRSSVVFHTLLPIIQSASQDIRTHFIPHRSGQSLGSLVVDKIAATLPQKEPLSLVIIGSGAVAEDVARKVITRNRFPAHITLFSSTDPSNAAQLRDRLQSLATVSQPTKIDLAHSQDELTRALHSSQVVITASRAGYLLKHSAIPTVTTPRLFIDLGNPRNMEDSIPALRVDHFGTPLTERTQLLAQATSIIEQSVATFNDELYRLEKNEERASLVRGLANEAVTFLSDPANVFEIFPEESRGNILGFHEIALTRTHCALPPRLWSCTLPRDKLLPTSKELYAHFISEASAKHQRHLSLLYKRASRLPQNIFDGEETTLADVHYWLNFFNFRSTFEAGQSSIQFTVPSGVSPYGIIALASTLMWELWEPKDHAILDEYAPRMLDGKEICSLIYVDPCMQITRNARNIHLALDPEENQQHPLSFFPPSDCHIADIAIGQVLSLLGELTHRSNRFIVCGGVLCNDGSFVYNSYGRQAGKLRVYNNSSKETGHYALDEYTPYLVKSLP